MPGNWHVRFGGAGQGNAPGETRQPRPGPTPYQAAGWSLTQTKPGILVWSAPHGRSYTVSPDAYPV